VNGQRPIAPEDSAIQEEVKKDRTPHKAAMYSALIPGLGQIYNKKYWKLPIIYGATGMLIYYFDYNNNQYNDLTTAYVRMFSGEITEYQGVTDINIISRAKDEARRNRDLNVISLAAIYLLNIVDATVDAHLFDYEINDDLSLNVQPVVKQSFGYQHAYGVSLSINF